MRVELLYLDNFNSQFSTFNLFRAGVLAVFARVAAILDGEVGAVVEAGEAEVAVSFAPSGLAVLDGDEMVGTEPFAEAAAGAGIARGEAACGGAEVEGVHGGGVEFAHATVGVEVAFVVVAQMVDDAVDFAFGTFEDGVGLGTVATFEHGTVGVGHQYREVGVDRLAQGFLEEADGIAGGTAGGEDGVGIVAAGELQLLCETLDGGGNAPEIDG